MADKNKPSGPEANHPTPSTEELLQAANFELQETKAALDMAQKRLNAQPKASDLRGSLDPSSLKHPNAFMAQDGRTYYKYKIDDGTEIVTPKPMEEMTLEDYERSFTSLSLMDPTINRMPQNLTVQFKDPQWAGQWFNKKAKNGYRVGYARSLGYVPVTIQDLSSYFAGLNDQDGAVEDNDLVLMKIHKAKLFARLIAYMKDAKFKGSIHGYKEQANKQISPKDQESDPFFHTPQAMKEFQGLGPVAHIPTVNR